MEKIYIPRLLKMPEQKEEIKLNHQISGLNSLTPVRGFFQVAHRGNFLELQLQANTILTLICDRCLRTFNHRLEVDTSEIILLKEEETNLNLPLEMEILTEDLSETLPPDGELIVDEWIYEQISLAMPLRNLCGNDDCQPPVIEEKKDSNIKDNRWSALSDLKSLIKE
ncbi:metal-binding [Geminocystis sp. NIES-3708]|uniref:YceD family protein n=1 Tax=Geminocystis sp. NIES-3708 TaxID=1615909 RepID=UPI0005FCC0FA|nr:YceD family protein [Geminocystis sp. NIES-3708]BAQ61393.1 metal-binding [Geminocystis sp. NIES-3708]